MWANERLTQTVLSLTETQQRQHLHGSFPSLHDTLLHIFEAGNVWWQRINMNEHVTWPAKSFEGNTAEAIDQLLQQDKRWQSWVQQASEAALDHVFHYQNSKKEKFRQPVFEVLMQIFNHATYHRPLW